MLQHARVLVADDDPDLLYSVAEALEQSGAEVVRAQNGAQLIERMADEGPFALVVTDISMPWMSGLQAMHSARFAGLGTPVIVMTGIDEDRLPEQVRALGPNTALLRKPFGLSELHAAAENLLLSAAPPNVEPSPPVPTHEGRDGTETVTQWLETVVEHQSEGIVLTDAEGRITFQNRAALLLSAPEPREHDASGKPLPYDLRRTSRERLAEGEDPLTRALLHDERVPARELITRAVDGRLVPVLVSALPLRSAAGKLAGAAMLLQDISHLKTLERFRESWVTRVLSDLRQPINTILLTSDVLMRRGATDEQRDPITRLRAGARRLSRILSELSDAFHVEARRVILLRERLDLVALARKVAEEPDLAGKVRLSAPPDRRVYVQSDPSRLERALANLLSFAASRLEKSPGREEVVVRIAESDGYAELTVPGGARGLPPEEVAVVFGPTAPPSDAAKGAGVGLYVAKGLIEVHGGRLTVEDVPGAPSTFRLTLPLDDSAASGPDTAEGIPQAGGA